MIASDFGLFLLTLPGVLEKEKCIYVSEVLQKEKQLHIPSEMGLS